SVLNDLRRRGVALLLERRSARVGHEVREPEALESLRSQAAARFATPVSPSLYVLARTLDQLQAVLSWQPGEGLSRPALVYCDFQEGRGYRQPVALARAAGLPIGLAGPRITKPGEEGFLRQVAGYEPDVLLVRNLTGLALYRDQAPGAVLVGDFS